MQFGKTIVAAFCVASLSACEAPRTFEDAGVYKGENYAIKVERVPDGLLRDYYISINNEQILAIDGSSVKAQADECKKVSFYVSQCTYSTQYDGKSVRIIQETDARPFQQAVYYSVFIEGALIRRLSTPLL